MANEPLSHDEKLQKLLLDATIESINRTRRTLVVLIGVVCLGFLHVFIWYGSWELARIEARETVIEQLERLHVDNKTHLGDLNKDRTLIENLTKQLGTIRNRRSNSQLEVPLVGFAVSRADFSVALQLVGIATLLWLIFNQERMNHSLMSLDVKTGSQIPRTLLEIHFGLVGAQGSKLMKILGRLLPLALPILSLIIVSTDVYDLYQFKRHHTYSLAFNSEEYRVRAWARLGTGGLLGLAVFALGVWSFRSWVTTETELTKFALRAGNSHTHTKKT